VGISVQISIQRLLILNAEYVTVTVTQISCGLCQSLETNSGIFGVP
jgi:hypothetical protein